MSGKHARKTFYMMLFFLFAVPFTVLGWCAFLFSTSYISVYEGSAQSSLCAAKAHACLVTQIIAIGAQHMDSFRQVKAEASVMFGFVCFGSAQINPDI